MNIREPRKLKQTAARRLENAEQQRSLLLIYAGITLGLSALITVVNYCLSLEIGKTGGLGSIGLRSVLSTIQTILPMAQWVVMLCLELGYCNAMLRIGRGQYASPNSLRMGMQRFGPLLRCALLQWGIYFAIGIISTYAATTIFLATPLSRNAMALLGDMMGGLNSQAALESALLLDDAMYEAVYRAMLPVFPIFGLVCLVLMTPVFYSYRLVNYVLVDNPGMSAMMVLRQSRQMMKRNRFALFRLDLSLWFYYLLSALVSLVGYGDVLLSLIGVSLPFSETLGYFLFYGVYLVLQLVIFFLLLNRVSVTYALAYESLLPEKPKDNAVVLGNIFQM